MSWKIDRHGWKFGMRFENDMVLIELSKEGRYLPLSEGVVEGLSIDVRRCRGARPSHDQ